MEKETKKWALILGASSGFGAATAIELSKNGYNIFGVHLDRAATMPNVEKGDRADKREWGLKLNFSMSMPQIMRRGRKFWMLLKKDLQTNHQS